MSYAKFEEATRVIKDEAIAYLAELNRVTVAEVTAALYAGHRPTFRQLHGLVTAGVNNAVELAKAGQINLD